MNTTLLHGAFLLPVFALLATGGVFLTMVSIELSKQTRDVTLERLYREVLAYTAATWGLLLVVLLGLTVGIPVLELSSRIYATVMAVVGIVVAVALGGMSFIGNQKLELYLQTKVPEYYNASIILMVAGGLLVLYGLLVLQFGYGDDLVSRRSASRKMISPGKPYEIEEQVEEEPTSYASAQSRLTAEKRASIKALTDSVLSKYRSLGKRPKTA